MKDMSASNPFRAQVAAAIAGHRQALLNHRLYGGLTSVEQLAVFMQHHAYAVWDFMSLLKALQANLTCVAPPWVPRGEPPLRRLIHEIVMGEESDLLPSGEVASHFELYLRAMREAGADTAGIERFIALIRSGQPVASALVLAGAPAGVRTFVLQTFAWIEKGQVHEIAAAFTYGREDLIPELFNRLVCQLEAQFPARLATLRYYLDRHITLDGDEHAELGRRMVDVLCAGDSGREQEAQAAAVRALEARIVLWDGIAEAVHGPAPPGPATTPAAVD